jgi:hypothetical protein
MHKCALFIPKLRLLHLLSTSPVLKQFLEPVSTVKTVAETVVETIVKQVYETVGKIKTVV